jgi:hypothetical protein
MRIADIGREEFEKAHRRALAAGSDEHWNDRKL